VGKLARRELIFCRAEQSPLDYLRNLNLFRRRKMRINILRAHTRVHIYLTRRRTTPPGLNPTIYHRVSVCNAPSKKTSAVSRSSPPSPPPRPPHGPHAFTGEVRRDGSSPVRESGRDRASGTVPSRYIVAVGRAAGGRGEPSPTSPVENERRNYRRAITPARGIYTLVQHMRPLFLHGTRSIHERAQGPRRSFSTATPIREREGHSSND